MIGHHLNTPQLHALNNLAQSKLVKMAASWDFNSSFKDSKPSK